MPTIRAMVSGPTRPVNIRSATRAFPMAVRCGVSPVESPTVPKAEAASNRTLRKSPRSPGWEPFPLSVTRSAIVNSIITLAERITTAIVLATAWDGIRR